MLATRRLERHPLAKTTPKESWVLLGNARCVNPRVVDGMERTDLMKRILNPLLCQKMRLMRMIWPTYAVRLCLNIDSGPVHSF